MAQLKGMSDPKFPNHVSFAESPFWSQTSVACMVSRIVRLPGFPWLLHILCRHLTLHLSPC